MAGGGAGGGGRCSDVARAGPGGVPAGVPLPGAAGRGASVAEVTGTVLWGSVKSALPRATLQEVTR